MKTLYKAFMGMLLAGLLLGCSGDPIRIPNTTDQPFDKAKGRKISAWAAGINAFIPPFPYPNSWLTSRQARAYEALLKQAGGDYVTDVIVTERWNWVAFLGTIAKTKIEATAYPKLSPKLSFDTTMNLNKADAATMVCIWRKQQQLILGAFWVIDSSPPVVRYPNIVIVRESSQMSDKLGLKPGAAYLRKEPDKYKFLEFVDLNMDDEALALRFGVSVPKTETPSQSR